jgi:integrase
MLSEARIRASHSKDRPYKIFDERGLFMLVTPSGGRLWRFRYRLRGVEKLLTLGAYPDVSLKRAREKRDDARRLVADEIDPSAKRQAERMAQADTFEAIGNEWLTLQKAKLVPETTRILEARLGTYLYPNLGGRAISAITVQELLAVLRRIEVRGKNETAHRVRSLASRVWRYAIATGRAERDITVDLRGALAPVKARNFAAIVEPARVGELLRAIHGCQGHGSVTGFALKLAPLVFLSGRENYARRSGPSSTWMERNGGFAAARMKMGEEHIVPLSRQAVEILREVHPLTSRWRYVFPSLLTRDRPMSENTINAALRRLGYDGNVQTGHGFRSMASTLLNEHGFPPDVIELQLAHAERNKVRAAYNKAQRLGERRKMMQWWSDYLDALRADLTRSGKDSPELIASNGPTP